MAKKFTNEEIIAYHKALDKANEEIIKKVIAKHGKKSKTKKK